MLIIILIDPQNLIYKAIEAANTLSSFLLSHFVIDGYMDFSPVQFALIEYLVNRQYLVPTIA
ncbi:hypothetical protein NDK43_11130 [Neobacillus pocheonensis]|uniref:Uncharacterized protein n=1 Tax=Neobacillus pocheonensis TaxID=363869 RepID=A0ABT0W935_9BACI|nr:hypothetical protein [Neobacillus pocheonensis]